MVDVRVREQEAPHGTPELGARAFAREPVEFFGGKRRLGHASIILGEQLLAEEGDDAGVSRGHEAAVEAGGVR